MYKILVTGGAGFIGHHLSNKLYEKGYSVEVWDNLSTGKVERLNPNITFKMIDVLKDVLPDENFDVIFHLASPTSVQESLENPEKYSEGCLIMTKKIADYANNKNVKYFVFASTASVYGDTDTFPTTEDTKKRPISPYAYFKLAAEDYLYTLSDKSNTKFTITRFFNVFGEEQPDSGSYTPAVAIFLKQYRNNEPITVTGNGKQTRDYIYVGDIVNFLIGTIGQDKYQIEVFNLGSGNESSIIDIANSFNSTILFIDKRKEPFRSLSDVSKAKKIYDWQSKLDIFEWVKTELNKSFIKIN